MLSVVFSFGSNGVLVIIVEVWVWCMWVIVVLRFWLFSRVCCSRLFSFGVLKVFYYWWMLLVLLCLVVR